MVSDAAEKKARLSVCVVEHNPLAADHLQLLLEREPAFLVSSFDPQPEPRRLPRQRIDAFVVDQATLPLPLSRLLRFLRLRHNKARFLLLDHPLADEELCRLLFLGIQGFLSYEEIQANLIPAVKAVLGGHYWMPAQVLEEYVGATVHFTARQGRPDVFTTRERRIVELVKRRLSNKEIAQVLNISEGTVKFHLANVFAKLGVRDRYALLEAVRPGRRPLQPLPTKTK